MHQEMLPKVSVIIPMYNCEKYVDHLLGSLKKQTFSDFEVICVDDGSTDHTLEKVKAFCAEDTRFTYITKKNEGAGTARNAGIDVAKGKYVAFWDADDEYSTEYLDKMVSAAELYDVDEVYCLLDVVNYKTGEQIRNIGFNQSIFKEGTPVLTKDVKNIYLKVPWAPTNALYRRDLIEKNHLRFSTTKVANDVFFIYAYVSFTTKILGVHERLVVYRKYIDAHSLTNSRWKHTEDVITVLLDLRNWLIETNLYDQYKESYLNAFIRFINYNSSFPLNPRYVEALTDALCAKGLFDHLSEEAFYNTYWKRYDTKAIQNKIQELSVTEETSANIMQEWSNRLLTITCVEKLAQEKYGRLLNPTNEEGQIKKHLQETEKRLNRELNSWNYRIGKVITYIPKKVHYRFFGKEK